MNGVSGDKLRRAKDHSLGLETDRLLVLLRDRDDLDERFALVLDRPNFADAQAKAQPVDSVRFDGLDQVADDPAVAFRPGHEGL